MRLKIVFMALVFLTALFAFGATVQKSDDGEFRGETKAKIDSLQEQNRELKKFNTVKDLAAKLAETNKRIWGEG